jgi:ariadne-1
MLCFQEQEQDDCIINENENDYEYDDNENENINTNTKEDGIFIDEKEIKIERDHLIAETMEKLFLKREDAILVMIYYKWNKDNLDDWYDDIESNKSKVGIELSDETKKKFKEEGVESNGNICLVCSEIKNDKFFSLNCGHQFCYDCWSEYLSEKIKYPLNILQVKCPQKDCTCVVYEKLFPLFIKDGKK